MRTPAWMRGSPGSRDETGWFWGGSLSQERSGGSPSGLAREPRGPYRGRGLRNFTGAERLVVCRGTFAAIAERERRSPLVGQLGGRTVVMALELATCGLPNCYRHVVVAMHGLMVDGGMVLIRLLGAVEVVTTSGQTVQMGPPRRSTVLAAL